MRFVFRTEDLAFTPQTDVESPAPKVILGPGPGKGPTLSVNVQRPNGNTFEARLAKPRFHKSGLLWVMFMAYLEITLKNQIDFYGSDIHEILECLQMVLSLFSELLDWSWR